MPSPTDRGRVPVTTDVAVALDRLHAGGLVAIPTETVYGLAADADDPAAVARVFEVKGRPPGHPLIVHVGGLPQLDDWAIDVPDAALLLADRCWPGPLTLLLHRAGRVIDEVTGGRDTVGIRVPAHPLTIALLDAHGGGLAAPSANVFGRVSPTTAAHVVHDLGDRLDPARDVVLDGGPCPIGVESTIVDCTVDPPQVLRPGGIPTEAVVELLHGSVAPARGAARASGMLASHYAPRCVVLLADDASAAAAIAERESGTGRRTAVLDRTGDLTRAARDLYADLRSADEQLLDVLVVVMPPAEGLGHAIRDRLTKAAHRDPRASPPDRPSRGG
jgi:L-threonylcarbamoyladenylate synthase